MRTFAVKPATVQKPVPAGLTLAGPDRAGIQPRLALSEPGDLFEREADRMAEHVMRVSAPAPIQRQCAGCEDNVEEAGPVPRQTVEGEEEEYPPSGQTVILRKSQTSARPLAAPPLPGRAGGESLPAATRARMEGAFGHDFSRVRIHRDGEAGELNHRLHAVAFTHGSHIYFGAGSYDPHGAAGQRLLAHELTHVVQQGQAAPQSGRALPVATGQPGAPAIQRFAIWGAGAVHEVNNLASAIVNGTPVGVTWPTLNGAIFWSRADARAAMRRPTIGFTPDPAGGFKAKVDNTPINTGSFDETVLAPGPWSFVAPRATIGAQHPTLAQCAGAGDSTFRAIGDPSDKAMFDANRRHEDRHATDHEAAFDSSLVPWDTNLILAEVLDEEFHGATEADAEAALWTRMGGTPDDVADKFMDGCAAAVVVYHGTAAGGPVGAPTDPVANADCSTSSAKYTNPS